MLKKSLILLSLFWLMLTFAFSAEAKGKEYEAIARHLKTKYQAKKVKIPFMWLARFAVSVSRPAGVKSFSVTVFEDLKFSKDSLDREMQTVMRTSFAEDWSPILRVRSRQGEQVYMYMRDLGKSVKIALVTIEENQATVIRATFNPDKLMSFIENPKIFGISLSDDKKETKHHTEEPRKSSKTESSTK